jgi:hypothetical protein
VRLETIFWVQTKYLNSFDADPDLGAGINIPDPQHCLKLSEFSNSVDYPTASVVDPDPVGSGINHFGSGSGQPLSRMNLKQNFYDKITISQPKAQIK